jgi:hypothetical protein
MARPFTAPLIPLRRSGVVEVFASRRAWCRPGVHGISGGSPTRVTLVTGLFAGLDSLS